jgi:HPt (histidine-containing phosphotransfer) domain-containing protein
MIETKYMKETDRQEGSYASALDQLKRERKTGIFRNGHSRKAGSPSLGLTALDKY